MKKAAFITVLFFFAGTILSQAQTSADDLMKTYNKVKGQYESLNAKYKPYKDMAIANADKLSPELKTSMQNFDTQLASFGKKLEMFPSASTTEQATMATTLKSDYSALKSSGNEVISSIKKMKLPKA